MTNPGNMTADGANMPSPAEGPLCRTFRGEPHQVPLMRDFVGGCLSGRRFPHATVDDILVCATELATNAVLHSRSGRPGGHFTVEIAIRAGQSVYVAVKDAGGDWTSPGSAMDDYDAEGGRGLLVVAALSADMGITGGTSGRTAWFLSRCG